MYNLTVRDIVRVCDGNLIFGDMNYECANFCTDTRCLESGDVYIGLKGDKFDGSSFYEDALNKGASVCILEGVTISDSICDKFSDRSIIIVSDSLIALQKLAAFKRSKYDIPVIGVTGSVGKTSTKDIIASVVSKKYNVLKTIGNLNNHIGLPLTILGLKDHDALVVEMGMNNLGEISLLSRIARPTIAVITNVGTAHIGNLGSRENILKAKLEILDGLCDNGTLIVNNDNDLLHSWNNEQYNVVRFGIDNESDFRAYNVNIGSTISYDLNYGGNVVNILVPIVSKPFIYNSLAAVCVGNLLGISIDNIKDGILNFSLTKNRMEILNLDGITVISDCYNANFDSMKASIESLSKMNGRKIAVLGDMLELGDYSSDLHFNVGLEVLKNNIDVLITVGEQAKNIILGANGVKESYSFDNNRDAILFIKSFISSGDVILVKASNGMHFIDIVNSLKEL